MLLPLLSPKTSLLLIKTTGGLGLNVVEQWTCSDDAFRPGKFSAISVHEISSVSLNLTRRGFSSDK
jgi:hypothetical protein